MAVLQMQRMSITGLRKERKGVLERLQSLGVMEISQIDGSKFQMEVEDTTEQRQEFEKKVNLFEQALGVLEEYAPRQAGMFQSLEGKAQLGKKRLEEIVEKKSGLVDTAQFILAASREIGEYKVEIHGFKNQIESLSVWKDLDLPLSYTGTQKVSLLLGTISAEIPLEDIYQRLEEEEAIGGVELKEVYQGKDVSYLAILCLKKDEKRVEEILRSMGFARPVEKTELVPGEAIAQLEQKIQAKEDTIEEKKKTLIEYATLRGDFEAMSDFYRARAERYQVVGTTPQSKRLFCVSGYVPQKFSKEVKRQLEENYNCRVDIEALKEEDQPPTILQNNGFSSSVEGVVGSYGLPKRGEIDPTTVMSVFYVFFFGLMLSDAAYGAVMSIACLVLLKKFPRMEGSMKTSLKLFFYCGLSTLIWGVLFGGYFGDAIQVVAKVFFQKEVEVPALWFIPLKDPMKMLIYSMLFGMVHLYAGLGLKGYICLKEKRYLDFFCDVILWYAFITGLTLLLIPSSVFTAISQTRIVFPAWAVMVSKVLAIGGALGLFLMSGRESKKVGIRLALGAYDLYNVTGWLSDVLSYSRLLALGLATGVIASVVNQMGSMAGRGILGTIIFILVFVLGHSLNMAINILGAYVHTNRLQFVEFFGKFYEGGGREFHPFTQNTKYIEIQEEMKS